LLANPSRESDTWDGFRLWKSTDEGQSFLLVNTSVPPNVTSADKPMIAVNNFAGTAYGPDDRNATIWLPRVRSYSMNGFVNPWRMFRVRTDMVRPGPAMTFVFLDEREDAGPRLCEPQQRGRLETSQFIAETLWMAKLLRVADLTQFGNPRFSAVRQSRNQKKKI